MFFVERRMAMSRYHAMMRVAGHPPLVIDEVGEFWVVTTATEQSKLIDILFKRTVAEIGLSFKGGLVAEDIIGLFKDEGRARKFALKQLTASA